MNYHVPSKMMLLAHAANYSDESLQSACNSIGPYLKSKQLDIDNVCSVLHTLLTIEDISEMQPYVDLMLDNVQVSAMDSKAIDLSIRLPREQAKIYEKQLTPNIDHIVLVPTHIRLERLIMTLIPHRDEDNEERDTPNFRGVARYQRMDGNRVIFNFYNSDGDKYPCPINIKRKYHIIFRSPRTPFIRMFNALAQLRSNNAALRYIFPDSTSKKLLKNSGNFDIRMSNTLEKLRDNAALRCIFPESTSKKLNLTLINKSIEGNAEQLQAVQQIVTGPDPRAPYIVFGPPGTGKTTTVVEAILQLYQRNNRILVTAGSNSACNTIAYKLIDYFGSMEKREHKNTKSTEFVRVFSNFQDLKNYTLKNGTLKVYSNVVSSSQLKNNYLSGYKIIVATLCSVGRICSFPHDNKFTHIFIDEVAASTEPEALIGIAIKGISCHVILSGDHKQLGPVIKSKRAKSLGLDRSLMERLMLNKLYEVDEDGDYDRTLQTRLRRNYRSHPEIVDIYNKLYYNGDLIPLAPLDQVNLAANWSILNNVEFPILFQAIKGPSTRKPNSTTWLNHAEARTVCQFVEKLVTWGLGNGEPVKQSDIGIITPYLGQCGLIDGQLRKMGCKDVKVGSVESYQGCEMPIIIVSMVSSFNSPQFLSNPRRINVFLSRPKSLLILIGNPATLSKISDLKYIIDLCKSKNNFYKKDIFYMYMIKLLSNMRIG